VARKSSAQSKSKPEERLPVNWGALGRWAMGVVLFALMGTGVGAGLMYLSDPQVLPLKVVRIDGQFRYLNRTDIEGAVGSAVRGNFFTLDADAVRQAALALPWVDQVSVRRVWPDTLVMWVGEQKPLASWGEKQVVNERGELFEPGVVPDGLPAFSGPDSNAPEAVERFRDISEKLGPLELAIDRLDVDARGAWRVHLQQGIDLQLGSENVSQRLERFLKVLPVLRKQAQQQRLRMVDLRYTNGLAVRWEKVETKKQQNDENTQAGKAAGKGVRVGRGQV
jgi:cell division protein FtsQ